MPNLIPANSPEGDSLPSLGTQRILRQTDRALARVEIRTLIRIADVRGDEAVAEEKLAATDRLTREAVSGQAFLRHWADHLAKNDLFLADELRFYTDIAKLGKGEILAATIDTFSSERR